MKRFWLALMLALMIPVCAGAVQISQTNQKVNDSYLAIFSAQGEAMDGAPGKPGAPCWV